MNRFELRLPSGVSHKEPEKVLQTERSRLAFSTGILHVSSKFHARQVELKDWSLPKHE